ncbi:glutathione S-transferase C-terminal-like protein [Boletus coccyginus]|nr:glutathione S-transferase C-terminal-like protein [Boletus coccyginus]
MTLVGTLWGQSKVILSVAALNGFELEQPQWTFANKSPEYTAKFPYGKIPAFEGKDGFKLIEGATIARYLSSIGTQVNLFGSNAHEVAVVDQWVHFAEHEIGIPTHNNTGMIYGFSGPFNLEARTNITTLDKNHERLVRGLAHFESHLAARPSGYVALDTLTLADLVLAGVIFAAARASLGSAERTQYPHIFTHYEKVTLDERVKQYWGMDGFVDVRIAEPKTYPFS